MKTSLVLIASIVLLFGCGGSGSNTNNNENTADSATLNDGDNTMGNDGNNTMNNNTWDQDKIKEFVDKAALGGLKEVQLGKIAQKKALSQQVRDYGKMMEKDHGDANSKFKPVLQALGYSAPTTLDKDHQDVIDRLNKFAGNEFDKKYMSEMADDHQSDVNEFEDAQKNLPAGELKTWVDNTLPVLRNHLQQAKSLNDQLK